MGAAAAAGAVWPLTSLCASLPCVLLTCMPPHDTPTSAAGHEYSPESESCVECPAGTQRKVGREDACVPW